MSRNTVDEDNTYTSHAVSVWHDIGDRVVPEHVDTYSILALSVYSGSSHTLHPVGKSALLVWLAILASRLDRGVDEALFLSDLDLRSLAKKFMTFGSIKDDQRFVAVSNQICVTKSNHLRWCDGLTSAWWLAQSSIIC